MSCFATEETKILFSSHCLSIILASRFEIDDVPEKYLCTQNLLTESFFDFFLSDNEKIWIVQHKKLIFYQYLLVS